MAVENGTYSFMPSKLLLQFEKDISPLMAFLGTKEDFVLYENTEAKDSFVDFWSKLNIDLPRFIHEKEIQPQLISKVYPWGWTQLIKNRFSTHSPASALPILNSPSEFKAFFSRQTSLELTHKLSTHTLPTFVSIPKLPLAMTSVESIADLYTQSEQGIVLKTLWSSSGRGLLFIRNQQQLNNSANWIKAQLKKHGLLIAEPIYNKVQDASLQFYITTDGTIEFLGINYFDADLQGHFSKEYFHTPESIRDEMPDYKLWLYDLASSMKSSMLALNIPRKYQGPIGIDAMFIRDKNGQLRFYPLVEANLRCNMGLINLYIKELIHSEANGTWEITQFIQEDAHQFYIKQIEKYPIQLCEGKIKKGFFPLTPFHNDTRFAAWGLIQ